MKSKEKNRLTLQSFFGIDDLQYGELVMDNAYRYLQVYLDGDQGGIQMITMSSFFWEWWTNQWDYRNQIFLDKWRLSITPDMSAKGRNVLMNVWLDDHNITPSDVRPNPQVVSMITSEWKKADELHDDMIRHVIKRETKTKTK